MKKLIVATAVVAMLAGCDTFAPPNPFMGTWSMSLFGTVNYTFAADKTVSRVSTPPIGSIVTIAGTYAFTDTEIDITWSDATTLSALYSISNNQMTLTPTTGGLPITLVKQ